MLSKILNSQRGTIIIEIALIIFIVIMCVLIVVGLANAGGWLSTHISWLLVVGYPCTPVDFKWPVEYKGV